MPRIIIAFLSFLLLVPLGLRSAVTLTTVVMSYKQLVNHYTKPPSVTSLSPTDQVAWLWFLVKNVSVGDDYSVSFYTPAGTILPGATSDFGPETSPGTFCYAVGMDIAGYTAATMPGTWNAYIYNKGSQIYKEPFTISGSAATCTYSLSSSSASVSAAGGSGSFTVTTGSGCTVAASSDVTWITPTVSGSAVNYTVQANTSTSSRTGHITVNGQTFTITQAGAAACTYVLSGSGAASPGITGGTFNVTAPAGCAWTAISNVSWITTTSSGSGNGTVTYTVAANTSTSPRTGTITVGGQTFTITQGGTTGALFTYNGFASAAGLSLIGSAATASTADGTVLRLTPATGSQSGAAYSTTPVTLGNNATFSTRFQFRFSNPGGQDPADGITFVLGTSTTGLGGAGVGMGYQGVGGKSVAIEFDTFDNTGYGLGNDDGNSSNHVSIDTNGALTNTDLTNVYGNGSCGFANGTPAQNPNTVAGCMSNGNLWTANISYDGSLLTVILTDPAEASSFTAINGYAINLASLLGQNTAYVGFTSGTGGGWENHDIVNWTFANTVQSFCTYSLSPSSASPGAAVGTGTVAVTAGTGCAWTATSNASWISVTAGASGTGNGAVSYSVAANTATSSRTGTLTIGGQTFTVTQAASGGGGTVTGNLIQNGDAESTPPGPTTDAAQATIPSWSTDGQIAVTSYAGGAGDLSPTTPGPANRGNNYFAGGPNNVSSKMTQTVDLSPYTAAIDAGTQPYTLDGWLGGFSSQNDNAVVTVTFQNASGGSLGTANIGPVLAADRGGVSELVERTSSGNVPAGTRKMLVTVTFTRTDGAYNDGALDNLSFVLGGGGSTASGVSVYYRFENGTAGATATGNGSIVDSMGNQNGTPSGAVTYSSDVPLSTVAGAANKLSLQLGTSGSVQFPAAFPLNSLTNATLEFYIKPTGTASEMDFLWTRTDSTDANRFNMGVLTGAGGNSIFLDYREPNGTRHPVASITIASSGWTHVAVVKSGNTWTSYANGVQQGQAVTDANPNLPTNTGWTLNARNVNQFAGLLDELRISNSALTPAQFLTPVTAYACTPSLSATSASPGAAQTTGTVTVTAGAGCAWTATSNATWITVTAGASGTGNGTVSYTVAANTGVARTGTLTIAGFTFTVSQASGASTGCSYNVNPTDIHATAAATSSTLLISTNIGCTWTASVSSGVTWITLNPTSGSGSGGVGYSIAANTGAARSTTITVAGTAVTVEQDSSSSCTYTLSSTSSPLIPGIGGVGSVAVTVAGTSCPAWTVATPAVSWVHVAGGSGSTSSGTVSYSVDSNTSSSKRSTTLAIANQNYTVQQDVAPCTYALSSPNSGTLAAGGASGSFQVTAAGPACTWSITLPSDANSQWIHVISALNAMSSGVVSYTVDPNNTTSARSLTLPVTGKNPATTLTYTVSQAAGAANTRFC